MAQNAAIEDFPFIVPLGLIIAGFLYSRNCCFWKRGVPVKTSMFVPRTADQRKGGQMNNYHQQNLSSPGVKKNLGPRLLKLLLFKDNCLKELGVDFCIVGSICGFA